MEKSLDIGLVVIGLSFHCGSGRPDPDSYRNAICLTQEAMDTIDAIKDQSQSSGNGF